MAQKPSRQTRHTPESLGERAERLLRGVRPGDRMTRDERVAKGREDFGWFCRYYLADYFFTAGAKFHDELSELIDTQDRVVCAAPREHAKSTVVSFAKPIQQICYELRRFIILLGATEGDARQRLDDIRQEIETNERILEDFGDLIGGRKWAEAEFITSTGVKCLARGRGQTMRGLRYKQWRPDMVIADDIEDDEMVESRQQRDKVERWLLRAVLGALGKHGQYFMVGTILHHDSVLRRFLLRPEVFVTRIWRAVGEDGKPLWPSAWPLERLARKRAEIGARNYATEFDNDPANEEDAIFSLNQFRRFSDDDIAGMRLDRAAAIDPAIGLKQKNDKTAVAVIGFNDGKYYLLKLRMRRLKIQQQVELVLATCQEEPGIIKFGFETVAYQSALKQLVEEASRRANLQIPAVAVDDISSDKIRRIGRLAPLVEQGLLLVPSAGSSYWSPDIEEALEQFEALGVSANSHDDGPDAIERAISLLRGKTARKAWARIL